MEVETDERDRQREMEEIEEIRKQIVDNRPEDMDEQVRYLSFGLKLTHTSDKLVLSPYNSNTLFGKQVMRLEICISQGDITIEQILKAKVPKNVI